MSQTTQIEIEPKGCICHNLGIQNENQLSSAKSNTPLRRNTQAPVSHLLQTFNRINTKSITQRDILSMSQTTQIELEPKGCIFHNLGIQNANRLSSAKSNTPLRRNTQAPVSHLLQTFNRINTKSITQRDILSMSQTTQI